MNRSKVRSKLSNLVQDCDRQLQLAKQLLVVLQMRRDQLARLQKIIDCNAPEWTIKNAWQRMKTKIMVGSLLDAL